MTVRVGGNVDVVHVYGAISGLLSLEHKHNTIGEAL